MVQYQKELQARLDTQTEEREQLGRQLEEQQQLAAAARQEVEQLRLAHLRQVDQLKQDLELKIRSVLSIINLNRDAPDIQPFLKSGIRPDTGLNCRISGKAEYRISG
jgi:hypothetical protein